VPELKDITPGPEWLRVALERIFVDTVPAQYAGKRQALLDFPADIIVGDDMMLARRFSWVCRPRTTKRSATNMRRSRAIATGSSTNRSRFASTIS
jgi:hypothetical protein